MTNALTTTSPADTFRASASGLLAKVSKLSLHELVDEFMRLTAFMDANSTPNEGGYGITLSDEGQIAFRQREIVNGASKARFGISFNAYDRSSNGYDSDF